jgi:PAS domain S-box-containing protein
MTEGGEGKGVAALFINAAVGTAIIGFDGRLQRVSNSFCRILDRTEEELVGRSFLEVTDPGDREVGVDDLTTCGVSSPVRSKSRSAKGVTGRRPGRRSGSG